MCEQPGKCRKRVRDIYSDCFVGTLYYCLAVSLISNKINIVKKSNQPTYELAGHMIGHFPTFNYVLDEDSIRTAQQQ